MAKRDFYVTESELDDFQRKVINRSTDSSFIVRGCAGSGKSILALWKAHDIIESKKGSVQMVVFNKSLWSYMATGMRKIGIPADTVTYKWKWDNGGRRHTKYLLVDEAQDYSKKDIDNFLECAEVVIFYGDSAQQLYGWRKENPPLTIEEIRDYTRLPDEQLVFNHRLPRKVAFMAQCFLEGDARDPLADRCKNEGTEKPRVFAFGSFEEQMNKVSSIIDDRGFEDVGILLPKNDQAKQVADYLSAHGKRVEYKAGREMTFNWDSSLPKVMTYHSAKGLQFEAVFLPMVEEVNEGFIEPFYVAMTRTYQSLFVLYTGQLPSVLDRVPKNLYDSDQVIGEEIFL